MLPRGPASTPDQSPPRTCEIAPRRRKEKDQRPPADLPLFAWEAAEPGADEPEMPAGEELDKVVQFPGLRL